MISTVSTSDERGAVAEPAEGERLLVDLRRQRLRRVDGPAAGDGDDLVEHPEAVDRAQRDAHGDRRREQRQRDLPEPPERRRAVDGRRLVELLGDALEPREVHRPSRARRTARRARRRSSTAPRSGRPSMRASSDSSPRRRGAVERTGIAEDELPDVGDGERAHHDRQEEDRPQQRRGLDRPLQREREREPDRRSTTITNANASSSVCVERASRRGIVEDLPEVVEPDPVGVTADPVPVGERVPGPGARRDVPEARGRPRRPGAPRPTGRPPRRRRGRRAAVDSERSTWRSLMGR